MEVILIIVALYLLRAILRDKEPTWYIHPSRLPLSAEEHGWYVRNGENVSGFEPAVKCLWFYVKTKG